MSEARGTERLVSLEDERALLAGSFHDHAPLLLVRPTDFSDDAHRAICEAAHRVLAHGGAVTRDSVRVELDRANAGAHVATATRLADLVPDLDSLGAVAERLRELAAARDGHRYARAAIAAFERGDLDDARQSIAMLGETRDDRAMIRSKTIGAHAEDLLRSWATAAGSVSPVGVPSVDAKIGGLERDGSLCVFGARTHVGKSYFALTCVDGLLAAGECPGVITAEDPAKLWAARALAAETRIPAERLRRGLVTSEERDEAARGVLRWQERGGHLVSAIGADIDHVVAAMAHLVRERGCTVLVIDYLQAITCSGRDPRQQTDRKLALMKSAAARLGVPWILFSQLRRPDELHKLWTEPEIVELKESGEIENRAEAILLGWRPAPTPPPPPPGEQAQPSPPLLVRIAKAKGMPTSGHLVVMRRGPGWLWQTVTDAEAREWHDQVDGERKPKRHGGPREWPPRGSLS